MTQLDQFMLALKSWVWLIALVYLDVAATLEPIVWDRAPAWALPLLLSILAAVVEGE